MADLNSEKNTLADRIKALFDENTLILPQDEIFRRLGIIPDSDDGGRVEGILGGMFGKTARKSPYGLALVRDQAHIFGKYYYPLENEKKLIFEGIISIYTFDLFRQLTSEGVRIDVNFGHFAASRRK